MTFYGNRVFADIINVRIKVRPSLVRVSPKSNESILIKKKKIERTQYDLNVLA